MNPADRIPSAREAAQQLSNALAQLHSDIATWEKAHALTGMTAAQLNHLRELNELADKVADARDILTGATSTVEVWA